MYLNISIFNNVKYQDYCLTFPFHRGKNTEWQTVQDLELSSLYLQDAHSVSKTAYTKQEGLILHSRSIHKQFVKPLLAFLKNSASRSHLFSYLESTAQWMHAYMLDLQFYLSRHWWLSLVRVAQRPGLAFPQILSGLFCCPPVGEFSSLLQALQYMFLLECFKCALKVLFNLKLNSWHFCSACGFIIPTVIKSLFSVSYP